MREIKFRGQKCCDGQWVYGHYVESHRTWAGHKPHKSWIVTSALSNGGFFNIMGRYAVKDDTVGQFTGLLDKNGKEIYEGDIVYSEFKDGSHTRCLVGWNEEEAGFGIMDEYAYRSKQEGYDFPKYGSDVLFNFRKHGDKFEVIGNIYDNPELLKQTEL